MPSGDIHRLSAGLETMSHLQWIDRSVKPIRWFPESSPLIFGEFLRTSIHYLCADDIHLLTSLGTREPRTPSLHSGETSPDRRLPRTGRVLTLDETQMMIAWGFEEHIRLESKMQVLFNEYNPFIFSHSIRKFSSEVKFGCD